MGTNIHGWVEINTHAISGEDIWLAVVDLGAVVSRNYTVFAFLFGVRATGKSNVLAGDRGLPADISIIAQKDLSHSDMVRHSWLLFEEIDTCRYELPLLTEEDWGWQFIFTVMQYLSEKYGRQGVRLVVAFDNYG